MQLYKRTLTADGKVQLPREYCRKYNIIPNSILYIKAKSNGQNYLLLTPTRTNESKTVIVDSLGQIDFLNKNVEVGSELFVKVYENNQILISLTNLNLYDEKLRYERNLIDSGIDTNYTLSLPAEMLKKIKKTEEVNLYCTVSNNLITLTTEPSDENEFEVQVSKLNKIKIPKEYIDESNFTVNDKIFIELKDKKIIIYIEKRKRR